MAGQRHALAGPIHRQTGEATKKLLAGHVLPDYSFPYAVDSGNAASQMREQAMNAQPSMWGRLVTGLTWSRTLGADEQTYNKSLGLLLVNAQQQGQATVGTPALSFLTGPAGSAMRALDAMASGYQIGQGVGKVRSGDTLSGATDISTGILNATSNVAAQWGITKGSGGAKAGTVAVQATEVVANRVGVPVTRSTNPLSPVREFDALGNEITYRTMSPAQAKQFELTGQLPATTETSMAASLEYASGKYTKNGGITFRLTTKPGTSAQLQEIGVATGPKAAAELNFPIRSGSWMETNASFKVECGQMTTQLRQGRALDIVNENLIDFVRLPKGSH